MRSSSRSRSRTAILPSVNRPSKRTPFLPTVSMTSADFLVVQQEIDELGDLDVIDCDVWLASVCDDEVLLLSSFGDLHVPCGNAVDVAAGEIGVCEVRFNQYRPARSPH